MAKTRTRTAAPARDTYMELVQRFPLKTIKSDEQHARATAVIAGLLGRALDAGAGDYLDALLVLVNKYEDEHHTPGGSLTPREALRSLMAFNGLRQADVGRVIGSESAVSMFLNGDRELSKAQIRKLADRFKVNPALFMG